MADRSTHAFFVHSANHGTSTNAVLWSSLQSELAFLEGYYPTTSASVITSRSPICLGPWYSTALPHCSGNVASVLQWWNAETEKCRVKRRRRRQTQSLFRKAFVFIKNFNSNNDTTASDDEKWRWGGASLSNVKLLLLLILRRAATHKMSLLRAS